MVSTRRKPIYRANSARAGGGRGVVTTAASICAGLIGIPDCLPIVGNLDEVAATVLLMRSLRRLGFEVVPA